MSKYMLNIYNGVYSVLLGMTITLRQLFRPNVTHQYPSGLLPDLCALLFVPCFA